MKKKLFSSKTLTIGGLCLLCVAILVGVLYWKSTPAPTFVPEADTSVGASDKWEDDGHSLPDAGNPQQLTDAEQPTESSENQPDDKYQVVIESEDEVIVNMTPPAEKPEAPEAPEGKSKPEDNIVPDTPASGGECIPSTPEQKPETSQPGMVYDPVFGWSELPAASGQPADSDGDPNKMIGSMG